MKQAILSVPWLASNFDIGEKYIRTIDKSVNYVFCGLRHNLDSIKSKARILLCWVDEAESVSEIAWQKLSPTVREEGSEIWVTWNPERDGSATDKRFRKEAGDDCITVEMNYTDNPWFPDVLEGERLNDQRRLDPATYAWVWEGDYLENSDKQVLAGKYRIAEFSENLWKEAERLFFGADFGFAKDPNTLVRSFILHNRLYIEYEAYGQQTELDHMPELYDTIPGARDWPIKADSARLRQSAISSGRASTSQLPRSGREALRTGSPIFAASTKSLSILVARTWRERPACGRTKRTESLERCCRSSPMVTNTAGTGFATASTDTLSAKVRWPG